MSLRLRLAALGITVAAAATAARATDIYTWIDDKGVVNYSTSVPGQAPAQVFKGDAKPRPPTSSAAPGDRTTADQRRLAERIDKLEADLDKERDARFALLQNQVEREREEVRQLRQEQGRLLDNFGPARPDLLAPAVVSPATVYYLPATKYHKHNKPKHKAAKPIVEDRRGYPPLSASPSAVR